MMNAVEGYMCVANVLICTMMQASGWGIVTGFGAFFAIFASGLVYLDIAFSGKVCAQM